MNDDNSMKELLREEFQDLEARRQYAADLLNAYIALQIKTLRQQRKWSQAQLARRAGKHQSQISEMESIDCSSWKVSELLKLAAAFDIALVVSFESFGDFLDDATHLGRPALERPSFKNDPAFKRPKAPRGREVETEQRVLPLAVSAPLATVVDLNEVRLRRLGVESGSTSTTLSISLTTVQPAGRRRG